MRPACPAHEGKSPPPFPPGNRRANPVRAKTPPRNRPYRWIPALALFAALHSSAQTAPATSTETASLPDSPGTTWSLTPAASPDIDDQNPATPDTTQPGPGQRRRHPPKPCSPQAHWRDYPRFRRDPCDPYRPFVETTVKPLTPSQKGYLAIRDFTDPFNLITVVGTSAFTIGINSHTAYGPGMRGFGYNVGTSLSQDATGEAIGTFAVCSLFHQDPRYFRMPNARFLRRLGHAIAHIAVAQGDNGRPMPNYSNFIAGAAGAEIANLYVPGLATDAASTTERIFTGFLTEPVGNIIAEFLPDVAARIHIHVVVVQRLLNNISAQSGQ